MKKASFLARLLAFLIDWFILSLVCYSAFVAIVSGYAIGSGMGILRGLTHGIGPVILLYLFSSSLIIAFYFIFLTSRYGATVGKSLLKIRVLGKDEKRPGILRAIVRFFFYGLSVLFFFLGFILAIFLKGRSLHDILAGTQVVEERI